MPPFPESAAVSARPPGEVLFSARGLTKVYPGGETDVRALDGVDLD